MIYKMIHKDLFDMSNDYYLAHCVNASYTLGAGIAKSFSERFLMGDRLRHVFPQPKGDKAYYVGRALLIGNVFNLVTKVEHYDKPSYGTLRSALEDMRRQCEGLGIQKVAMPKIGCGLDRLEWEKVEAMILDVFGESYITIVICYL